MRSRPIDLVTRYSEYRAAATGCGVTVVFGGKARLSGLWADDQDVANYVAQDPARLIGRTLLIRHGDDTTHAWTLTRIEPIPNRRVRLYVREEPGFLIEGEGRAARYYQFPRTTSPGPHTFSLATIRR